MILRIVAEKMAAESAEKPRIHAPFRELYPPPPPPLNNLKAANGGKNAIDDLFIFHGFHKNILWFIDKKTPSFILTHFFRKKAFPQRRRTPKEKKWVRRDSNPQPKDYESSALTVELLTRPVPVFLSPAAQNL